MSEFRDEAYYEETAAYYEERGVCMQCNQPLEAQRQRDAAFRLLEQCQLPLREYRDLRASGDWWVRPEADDTTRLLNEIQDLIGSGDTRSVGRVEKGGSRSVVAREPATTAEPGATDTPTEAPGRGEVSTTPEATTEGGEDANQA